MFSLATFQSRGAVWLWHYGLNVRFFLQTPFKLEHFVVFHNVFTPIENWNCGITLEYFICIEAFYGKSWILFLQQWKREVSKFLKLCRFGAYPPMQQKYKYFPCLWITWNIKRLSHHYVAKIYTYSDLCFYWPSLGT